jgi:hypothetical protein
MEYKEAEERNMIEIPGFYFDEKHFRWFAKGGRTQANISGTSANLAVPMELANMLTREAVALGFANTRFSPPTMEEKKEKKKREARIGGSKKKESGFRIRVRAKKG